MPGKRNSKKLAKSRDRKNNGDYPMVGVTRSPLIVPSRFTGKMMYHSFHILAPAGSAVAYNTFRMNSVYDPDFTGVGSSVTGYTQLAALYGRYRVTSAKISFDVINTSTTVPLTVFLALNSSNNVGTDIKAILAQRYVWSKSLATVNGNGTLTHTASAPVHQIYGVPKTQVLSEDDFAAVTGGNPNNVVYAHLGAFTDAGAVGSFYLQVSIEYHVAWSLPLELV
jgi:hypothetical protein